MKTKKLLVTGTFAALLTCALPGNAEDIDLYSSAASVTGTDLPNVLFIWDNAANANASAPACTYDGGGSPSLGDTSQGIEQCALYNSIKALPVKANGGAVVNIGIMVFNANGLTCSGVAGGNNGGCLVQALTPMDATGKTSMLAFIKGLTTSTIQSNGEATAQAMQEAWAYYAGKTGMSGRTYTSPALAGCQKNFIIFIGNAGLASSSPGDASSTPGTELTTLITTRVNPATTLVALTADQQTLLKTPIQIPTGAYGTSTYNCSPNPYVMSSHTNASAQSGGLYADEWARYMKSTDLVSGAMPSNKAITTYTIGVLTSACKPEYPALLTSMAKQGSGKYFATGDATEIQQAILRVLNEVQAVNSVFSSSSLPVSVNAQGTFLNQIYMGMFRPDSGGLPRWKGNLKQYQFAFSPTSQLLTLADAKGVAAVSAAGTGFISPNAASFWTCGSSTRTNSQLAPYNTLTACSSDPITGFWANDPNGAGLAWDLPDGEVVEKGGAAQMLRLANLANTYTATPGTTSNPRNLYTVPDNATAGTPANPGPLLSATPFDSTNNAISDALLGTGARSITSIVSAATLTSTSTVPGAPGTPSTVSITAFARSGNTVTATVAPVADIGTKIVVGTQLNIATGTKYDCNPCTVTAIDAAAGTFTYITGGPSGTPTVPYTATVYTNFVTVTKTNHGLQPGMSVTPSACSLHTALNATVITVVNVPNANTFELALTTSLATAGTDTACIYAPNIATVTTSTNHGFSSGAATAIAGATPAGYNGTWAINATGATTFTYQYTALAPLAGFYGAGATATANTVTRTNLARWIRGEDNLGDELSLCPPGTTAGTGNCPTPAINIRPSLHGDVLHSRPVVINYGGTKGVVVFYGDNGGVFHAVNGNQVNPTGSTMNTPGGELWGFVPPEFYGKLLRLHDNSPAMLVPSTPPGITPAPQHKDYFIDGSTGVYQVIDGNGVTTTAVLYLTMRRGGRFIYALDVSDPAVPKFLWKHSNADTGFAELGQTWSQPKVAMVKGHTNPVLIFGGGYSTAEDSEPPTADSSGRGIFILDALDGTLVWKATYGASASCPSATAACTLPTMSYSIPSDITLLDRDHDGKIDRMYVGDLGGNVWRVDLEPTTAGYTPAYWQAEKIAALGCATGLCASGVAPRKIFYPPEVITTTRGYDAVFVTTGDREHPLYSTASQSACTVSNRAYLLMDASTGMDGSGNAVLTETNLFDATLAPWDGTLDGYYVTFKACEKAVNAPLVTAGYIYFGTNQAKPPTTHRCEEALGEARGYKLSPFTGAYTSHEFDGGGLPPSPVSGVVNVVVDGKTIQVPFCIGCGGGGEDDPSGCTGNSALAGCKPPITVSTKRNRTYWYIEGK